MCFICLYQLRCAVLCLITFSPSLYRRCAESRTIITRKNVFLRHELRRAAAANVCWFVMRRCARIARTFYGKQFYRTFCSLIAASLMLMGSRATRSLARSYRSHLLSGAWPACIFKCFIFVVILRNVRNLNLFQLRSLNSCHSVLYCCLGDRFI